MSDTPAAGADPRPPRLTNTVEQVQERLHVGRSTVFELIRDNKLRSVRVGRRRLITEQSLRDFVAELDAATGEK